jgi:hypothetical protein
VHSTKDTDLPKLVQECHEMNSQANVKHRQPQLTLGEQGTGSDPELPHIISKLPLSPHFTLHELCSCFVVCFPFSQVLNTDSADRLTGQF